MKHLLTAVVFAVLTVGWSATATARTLGRYGVTVSLPSGWHGVSAPGELQAADFPLPETALSSAQSLRVGRGHLHLIVWDYGPVVPYLAGSFASARPPITLRRRNVSRGALEGFSSADSYTVRTVALGGELLELVADLGPKPLVAGALARTNRVLATLHVQPPLTVPADGNRLVSDGVGLRLLAGWSGRIELPADRHTVRLVLRAHHGNIRLVLLELNGGQGAHADLPIALTPLNLTHGRRPLIARRVFSTAGRGFDLSAVVPSASALSEVNRLLATLTAVPRAWTFRSCNLTLRLPGTWRAAINPRSGCYPIITLHGPGITVVLTELRPGQPAADRVLTRSGRRFHVDVTPTTATRRADSVLATLHAKHR